MSIQSKMETTDRTLVFDESRLTLSPLISAELDDGAWIACLKLWPAILSDLKLTTPQQAWERLWYTLAANRGAGDPDVNRAYDAFNKFYTMKDTWFTVA